MNPSRDEYTEAVWNAVDIARKAHEGQTRHNGESYLSHPVRVAEQIPSRLTKHMPYNLCLIAALLHDVLEDTWATVEYLREQDIPEQAIEAIVALTRNKNESYEDFVVRASRTPIAKAVKEVDIVDNLGVVNYLGADGDLWFDAANEVQHARRIYKYMRALAFLRGKMSEEDYLKKRIYIGPLGVAKEGTAC